MGVSIFGDIYVNEFGNFSRAFISIFRITAGDSWVTTLTVLEPDGSVNWKLAMFTTTYIVVVDWLLLQVGFFTSPSRPIDLLNFSCVV
jgi:hypothetical protein